MYEVKSVMGGVTPPSANSTSIVLPDIVAPAAGEENLTSANADDMKSVEAKSELSKTFRRENMAGCVYVEPPAVRMNRSNWLAVVKYPGIVVRDLVNSCSLTNQTIFHTCMSVYGHAAGANDTLVEAEVQGRHSTHNASRRF